jgi:hypothetical protein
MFSAQDSASEKMVSDVVDLETCPVAETVDRIEIAETHDWTTYL